MDPVFHFSEDRETLRVGGVWPKCALADRTMIEIPARFLSVWYDGWRIPDRQNDIESGANCQRFAYALLAAHGVRLPPCRSSELWDDREFTVQPDDLQPLDLMLFHAKPKAWGAHVAVFVGEESAIHLSKAVGHPAIWPMGRFALEDRYRCFIGVKRVLPKS